MRRTLARRIEEGGYDGYAYAYPHKTSYRPFASPVPLAEAWQGEITRNLFLYVHLPFCEMRCGFCNLFTTVQPGGDFVEQTLAAIRRQSEAVAHAIKPQGVAQAAFGGGTPSFLTELEIEQLFLHLSRTWPVTWGKIPVSFEVSPGTITPAKLALLKQLGVDRISLGVQSFIAEDLISLKRPQPAGELERACGTIKSARFPVFNLDLIYGNEGQDAGRWQRSLDSALEWQPEELYLYPLYVGKLTNLDRSGKRPGEHRRDLYRQARDFLGAAGYHQISMRLFRRADVTRHAEYCCQEDGMAGFGPGARSYTRSLHYSTEYSVGQTGVKKIIQSFNERTADQFAVAGFGATLDLEDQKRRYVIKSLLRMEGVSFAKYQERFGSSPLDDLPQLNELSDLGLLAEGTNSLRLNAEGLAYSDTIGPWLYSDPVTATMEAYELT
ncbi:MAG TPA: STM4012 family radical SAM protein [Candidatus Sulfotelmatobacter sp.]|jgi:oxygen-independent coproporphyrinogen-3 oxidase|nr:STM4012 family radical SAM protein [Candidatus Sulfotelmatobacter sp.]